MMRASSAWFGVVIGCVVGACNDEGAASVAGDTQAGPETVAEVGAETVAEVGIETVADVESETVAEVEVANETVVEVENETVAEVENETATSVPLAGFGAITGACGVLDTELTETAPSLFVDHLDFGTDPYDDADLARLTAGGQQMIADGNAGGSSVMSEVFAYEVLARCELATFLKSETKIVYDVQGKITDLLVSIDGVKIGVSVTRAIAFPFDSPYTVEQATTLLKKKLGDIKISTADVSAEDRWTKQILSVIAYSDAHAASIEAAWNALGSDVRGDTIVFVTVSDGDDAFIY